MQTTGKDICIDLGQDRPGMIAKAFDAIAKAKINVDGYSEDEGTLHVFTTNPAAARKAIEGAGFKVKDERDVVVADAEDRPGTAARVSRHTADDRRHGMGSGPRCGLRARVVAPRDRATRNGELRRNEALGLR